MKSPQGRRASRTGTPESSKPFSARDYLHYRYWFMWLGFGLLRLVTLFPYSLHVRLGRYLGRFILFSSAKKEHIVDTNLALCFPQKSSDERERIKRESFENFGISVFELAMCWWWKADRLKPLVEIRGMRHIEKCREDKQAVILLSGHCTSLEIGGRLLALSLPFQAMYTVQKNPFFDSLLYSKRKGYLVDMISRKNTRRMIKAIRSLTPVWYAPDQNFPRERNVFAPFFGTPAATITATSRLARAGKAVVLPYFPQRKADGSGYILSIQPPLEAFPSSDELADATRVNASIEEFVRQHPEQYMWMHARFMTRPPGEAAIY